jgi:putative spermidine/putrescine transport system permease protein
MTTPVRSPAEQPKAAPESTPPQRRQSTPASAARLRVTRRSLLWTVAIPPVALLLAFFALPLAYLLFISLMSNSGTDLYTWPMTLGNYTAVLADPFYLGIIERTLLITVLVLALSLLLGYPVALYLVRLPLKRRVMAMLVLMFPMMVSNVVRAYGWVSILSRNGVLSSTLQHVGLLDYPKQYLYSIGALTVGLMTILLPFMIISITNSLAAIDRRYYEAAESLGASPLRVFREVTFPLSTPGVTSGLLLVTFLALSAYVSISLLGGARYKLLVSMVFDAASTAQWPKSAALSFVLLAVALLLGKVIQLLLRPQRVQGRA